MTYIPNVREDTIRKPFSKKEEDNPYYEGYLNSENMDLLCAYDRAMSDAMSFFDNLDNICGLSNIRNVLLVDTQAVEESDTMSKIDILKLNKETQAVIKAKNELKSYVENKRNEFVVSLLNGQKENNK